MNVTQLNFSDARDLDLANAKLAYTIVLRLLEHNAALSDLLVLMAQALDEDAQKALTATAPWQKYLESKRELETTRTQIEKFTVELKKLEQKSAAESE